MTTRHATLGESAFHAYREFRNGKNHDGTATPTWDMLTPEIQAAWSVAAQAAVIACDPAPGTSGLDFSDALVALKAGHNVQRVGWNGKGMWLALVSTWAAPESIAQVGPTLPFIVMRTAQAELVPWLASQTDVLAHDWTVLVS